MFGYFSLILSLLVLEEEKYHGMSFGIQPDENNFFESLRSLLDMLRDEYGTHDIAEYNSYDILPADTDFVERQYPISFLLVSYVAK